MHAGKSRDVNSCCWPLQGAGAGRSSMPGEQQAAAAQPSPATFQVCKQTNVLSLTSSGAAPHRRLRRRRQRASAPRCGWPSAAGTRPAANRGHACGGGGVRQQGTVPTEALTHSGCRQHRCSAEVPPNPTRPRTQDGMQSKAKPFQREPQGAFRSMHSSAPSPGSRQHAAQLQKQP